jgi:hypothetical protein
MRVIEKSFDLYTSLFEVTTPGAHFINPRCFGEDFAQWLSERLRARGFTPESPVQEDWGWVLIVPHKGHRFTVSIGVMDESIGHTPAEWRVGISFEKPLNGFRAWFRPVPAVELSRVAEAVEQTLREETHIERISPI